MKQKHETDRVIAELVATASAKNMTMRERYLLTESLRSLVRLAKSELMAEIKNSVHRLTDGISVPPRRRRIPASDGRPLQQGFEFNQFD
ncbi:MAG: hypothetical protein Q7T64_15160 [Lacisediminimonas sp.]|nr:hypothetical protein [Lacisediminimonas sp.]